MQWFITALEKKEKKKEIIEEKSEIKLIENKKILIIKLLFLY